MASQITTVSMISTVVQSRFMGAVSSGSLRPGSRGRSCRFRPAGPAPGSIRVSSSRASPAVITDPVISTRRRAGQPAARGAPRVGLVGQRHPDLDRVVQPRHRPDPVRAEHRAGQSRPACRDRRTGARSWRSPRARSRPARARPGSPGTSLSSLTARMAISSVKAKASPSAATVAAIPAGLCAASTITTGLRRTISSRPERSSRRTRSAPGRVSSATRLVCRCRPSPLADAPANASTAARAQAALEA